MRSREMRCFTILAFAIIHLLHHTSSNPEISMKSKSSEWKSNPNRIDRGLISRERRYVTFPEGSSLAVVFCLTTATPIMDDIFTHGIGFGSSYDLPNDTKYLFPDKDSGYETEEYVISHQRRRDRRDIYRRMENILDSMGLPGRACVLRTLCESSSRLASKRGMLEELLRVIFTIPQARNRKELHNGQFFGDEWSYTFDDGGFDASSYIQYDKAFLLGQRDENPDCGLYYQTCRISVLDLILPR